MSAPKRKKKTSKAGETNSSKSITRATATSERVRHEYIMEDMNEHEEAAYLFTHLVCAANGAANREAVYEILLEMFTGELDVATMQTYGAMIRNACYGQANRRMQ